MSIGFLDVAVCMEGFASVEVTIGEVAVGFFCTLRHFSCAFGERLDKRRVVFKACRRVKGVGIVS